MTDPRVGNAFSHQPELRRPTNRELVQPITTWKSFWVAAALLLLMAAVFVLIGVANFIPRSGPAAILGASLCMFFAAGLLLILVRGGIRLAKSGTTD